MTRFLLLMVFGMLCITAIVAQPRAGLQVRGSVYDSASDQPISYATIVILSNDTGKAITGTTTDDDGVFELPVGTEAISVELSFIGYTTRTIADITFEGSTADLGLIYLGEDAEMLGEVVVTAEKSSTEFRLDKRIFNVGQDLSSTGASALEVLNNVPSVNVSIEGSVTLRGAGGVQMLINGKPSVLASEEGNALGSITADMIDKIEVITNPSAKYEAEGTSGIINIILKKEEKRGINGSVTLNTGIPHNHSLGLSVNRRTDRFNLFSQLGVGYRSIPSDTENRTTNLRTGEVIASEGLEFRDETFYNFILGSDYYIDENNVLTLSGSVTYEVEDQPSTTDFELLNSADDVVRSWQRSETTQATNPKIQYELQYKRDFTDHKEHDLIISAIGNYFGKDQESSFTNRALSGDLVENDQETETQFEEGKYTFQVDYTRPFDGGWTMETGAMYVLNNVRNDFEVRNLIDGVLVVDPGFTNVFDFQQNVLGVYGTGAYETDVWGFKAGLRVENTELNTLLVNTNDANNRNFTNLFPSAFTSYKLSDGVSFQAGYSRRIYRPRLWDLNPFFNVRNNFSIRAGNPDLQPEFTDSYEVGSIFIWDDISMNASVYYRYTQDVIERISTFEDNVTTFLPINLGSTRTTGLEWNAKYTPTKAITINADFNYNAFQRDGTFNDAVFDFAADQWSSRLTSKFKVSRALDFEVTGRYQSSVITVQGRNSANLFGDFGLRYKIGKGKSIINLSVRDVFASRFRENNTVQDDFIGYSFSQRGRFITLGYSYGFGKGEAMEYRGSRRR